MKKILAIVLALCLALSLSVSVFADNSPYVGNNSGVASDHWGLGAEKYTYSAVSSTGAPLNVTVETINIPKSIYDEVADYGVIALFYINVNSVVDGNEMVTIDLYAPGATDSSVVIVRDAWEVLPNVTIAVNGDRVALTAPAGVLNAWHYVAIVKDFSSVEVVGPAEDTNPDEDEEVDEPGDELNVGDDDSNPAGVGDDDSNPGTGLALAVVPMIVAAAAVVVSKKR